MFGSLRAWWSSRGHPLSRPQSSPPRRPALTRSCNQLLKLAYAVAVVAVVGVLTSPHESNAQLLGSGFNKFGALCGLGAAGF
jgi:hypothetical protein